MRAPLRAGRRSRSRSASPRSRRSWFARWGDRTKRQCADLLIVDEDLESIQTWLRYRHGGQVDHDVGGEVPPLRMLAVHRSRRQVEDDWLLENRFAILIGAVNLHLVRSFRFDPARQKTKHHGTAKRRRELVAPQGVDAGAEDVDQPVGRTLRCVGEQRPVEPQPRDFTGSPPLTTRCTFAGSDSSLRSATGSPGTPMRSPHDPGSSVPTPFMPIVLAATVVAARMQSIGSMPSCCMSRNSSPLVPCGPTPVSVPKAIFTPASTAMRMLSV